MKFKTELKREIEKFIEQSENMEILDPIGEHVIFFTKGLTELLNNIEEFEKSKTKSVRVRKLKIIFNRVTSYYDFVTKKLEDFRESYYINVALSPSQPTRISELENEVDRESMDFLKNLEATVGGLFRNTQELLNINDQEKIAKMRDSVNYIGEQAGLAPCIRVSTKKTVLDDVIEVTKKDKRTKELDVYQLLFKSAQNTYYFMDEKGTLTRGKWLVDEENYEEKFSILKLSELSWNESDKPLFYGDSRSTRMADVQQGLMNDSSLMAALICISKYYPDYMNKIMIEDNFNDSVIVTLVQNNVRYYVEVKKRFVVAKFKGDQRTYGLANNSEVLWPAIMEKAYALFRAKKIGMDMSSPNLLGCLTAFQYENKPLIHILKLDQYVYTDIKAQCESNQNKKYRAHPLWGWSQCEIARELKQSLPAILRYRKTVNERDSKVSKMKFYEEFLAHDLTINEDRKKDLINNWIEFLNSDEFNDFYESADHYSKLNFVDRADPAAVAFNVWEGASGTRSDGNDLNRSVGEYYDFIDKVNKPSILGAKLNDLVISLIDKTENRRNTYLVSEINNSDGIIGYHKLISDSQLSSWTKDKLLNWAYNVALFGDAESALGGGDLIETKALRDEFYKYPLHPKLLVRNEGVREKRVRTTYVVTAIDEENQTVVLTNPSPSNNNVNHTRDNTLSKLNISIAQLIQQDFIGYVTPNQI